MQTFISCVKVQLKLNFTIKHLLRKGTNDTYNEVKACSKSYLSFYALQLWMCVIGTVYLNSSLKCNL